MSAEPPDQHLPARTQSNRHHVNFEQGQAIVGVGAARKVSAVRWNVASNIVVAWVVTLPAAGLMAALFYALCGLLQ